MKLVDISVIVTNYNYGQLIRRCIRVDADDYVQPTFLYMLGSFLKFNPAYVGVSCDYFLTDNEERILSVESFNEHRDRSRSSGRGADPVRQPGRGLRDLPGDDTMASPHSRGLD